MTRTDKTRIRRPKYEPTDRERSVLDQVENPRYDRQIVNGLDPFIDDGAPADTTGDATDSTVSHIANHEDPGS